VTRALVVAALLLSTAPALAHELRPAYLELRQTSPRTYDVSWKVPALDDGSRLALYVRLPEDTARLAPPRAWFANGAYLERWGVERDGGLSGELIRVDGLRSTLTDVLVRVQNLAGTTQTTRLTPAEPSFVVETTPSSLQVVSTYLRLGLDHILLGIDHLLFVLALLLLVRGRRRVVETITAFTVAHTITLAAATLGYVHVPAKPVEATIALSIVFVAAEIVHGSRGQPGLSERWPWIVAFTFGLLHGLGFAGALSETGLPETAIPLALLCFNAGVEIGQLLFVAAVVAALSVGSRLVAGWTRPGVPARIRAVLQVSSAYAIGVIATYWLIDRTIAFWT
jgi:hydrogenase/urease accessory protein HupE